MNKNMNFLLIYHEVWVNKSWLLRSGIPYKTIVNGISKESSNKWISVPNKADPYDSLILYSSIPVNSIKRYGLPTIEEALKIAIALTNDIKSTDSQLRMSSFAIELEFAMKLEWGKHLHLYHKLPVHQFVTEAYCKNHVAFEHIISQNNQGEKLIDLFAVYKTFQANSTYKLIFQTNSYSSFQRKIKSAEELSIKDVLVHSLFQSASNNKIINREWELRLEILYRDQRKLNYSLIKELINKDRRKKGLPDFSYSAIYKLLTDPYRKNKNLFKRGGETFFKTIFSTYSNITSSRINEVWEIDGTRMPFMLKTNKKSEFKTMSYMILIDTFSKKIIGYSLGLTEDSIAIKKCLFRAVSKVNYLPKVLVHDGARSFFSQEVKYLKFDMEKHGMTWIKHKARNPQAKGTVERIQQTLDTKYFRLVEGFLGEGIKSKRENARPSVETLTEYGKWHNYKTAQELHEILVHSILAYNSELSKNETSPNKVYEKGIQKNINAGIRFENSSIAYSFFEKVKRKISNSVFILKTDNIQYEYNIPIESRLKCINTRVTLVYNKMDLKTVYFFDCETEKFICELKQKTKISRLISSRTENEREEYKIEKYDNNQLIKNIEGLIKSEENEYKNYKQNQISITSVIPGGIDKEDYKYLELQELFQNSDKLNLENTIFNETIKEEKGSVKAIYRKSKNFKIEKYNGKA